jgi:hypothetical protein
MRTFISFFILFAEFTFMGCSRSYGRQACRMEQEFHIANTKRVPKDVVVISNPEGGYIFAWSADNAAFVSLFSPKNDTFTAPVKIPPPGFRQTRPLLEKKTFWPSSSRASVDAEDLAIISLKDGSFIVFMLKIPQSSATGGAFAALFSKDAKPQKTVFLGPAGEYSTEITAVLWNNRVFVAWHDGALNDSRIRTALIDPQTLEKQKESDFQGTAIVASPTAAVGDGRPVIAWSETGGDENGPKTRINTALVRDDLSIAAVKTVAKGRFIYPSPRLISKKESSGLGLVFRDDADEDNTPEFYFLSLNGNGSSDSEKKRISKADGFKGPSLDLHGNFFVSAAVRSFQQNLLIGLNRFDNQGIKQNGEFQVYADKSDFVRVDIAHAADSLMMIYAEDRHSQGRVSAGRIFCSQIH